MNTKYFNSSYTLQQIENSSIDKYIITYTASVVKNNDNTGNVIIYETDENKVGVMQDDFSKTKYTSLYIGDEHIASGFGFTNLNQKSEVISNSSKVPELFSYTAKLSDTLEKYILKTDANIHTLTSNGLTVRNNGNFFNIDNYKYSIEIADNNEGNGISNKQLYIKKESNLIIHNVELYYDIIDNDISNINNFNISNNNYISLHDDTDLYMYYKYNIKFKKLIVFIENSKPIISWKLTYYNKKNNIVSEESVAYDKIDDNDISVYKLYDYSVDQDKYGDLYNGQYVCDLTNSIYNNIISIDDICDIQLIFTLFDSENNSAKVYLPLIKFIAPIYFGLIESDNILNINIENISSGIIFDLRNLSNININYISENPENEYYCLVAIPNKILNDNKINFKFKQQIEVELEWNNIHNNQSIKDIEYSIYTSPYKYKGNTNWILSLT